SFTYSPAPNYHGPDSFTYRANDGTVDSNVATVSITVTPVNDAPAAASDAYSTAEDTVLVVAAPGVLANDTDVDGDTLRAVLVSGPSCGTLPLNTDGSFAYTPNLDFHGTDSFTYRATDGTATGGPATVILTVTPVNDPPGARDDSYATAAGAALVVTAPGVLGNDTDIDGDALAAQLGTGPAPGPLPLTADGSFTYTPAAGFSGTDTFTYWASDGSAVSGVATVTLTVSPADRPGVTLEQDPLDLRAFVLVVRGTSRDDDIDVKRAGNSNRIEVTIRSPGFRFSGSYPVTFTRVVLYGLAGDDRISVQDKVTGPAWLFGGDGNGQLHAGGGRRVRVGGDGDDQLEGGRGSSLLIGGAGRDRLKAQGDAVLIGSATAHDADALALGAILDGWASAGSYPARVAGLTGWLNASTVHDD